MEGYYSEEELAGLGLAGYGKNVIISNKTSLYKVNQITIGDNVRIDDYCLLAGKIVIGSFVHIAAGCIMYGGSEGIYLEDYVGVSSRGAIYAITDSYAGDALTNPTVPMELRNVIHKKVVLKKHAIMGTSCVVLPGVVLEEGCAVSAMSLVSHSMPSWSICAGVPARVVGDRKKDILELEKQHKAMMLSGN